ncbi:unnamed protein product [Allacma fusca]|uniref:Uncharacterized protein n=1 Tax=Allacma fusca TaxID=39272 RepID=A0A8J2NYL3_9HEXA|nr:unnamed protein product [Allacma fusca]
MQNLISEFRHFQKVLLNEILELKSELGIIKCSVAKKNTYESLLCPLDIPLKNKSELDVAEELLGGVTLTAKLVSWCETTGGKDFEHHIRRLLSKLLSHSFSLEINFTGTSKQGSPKIAFKGTNLCKIIVSSVARSQNVNEAEVEQFCGRWFHGGADRYGGRAKRS